MSCWTNTNDHKEIKRQKAEALEHVSGSFRSGFTAAPRAFLTRLFEVPTAAMKCIRCCTWKKNHIIIGKVMNWFGCHSIAEALHE